MLFNWRTLSIKTKYSVRSDILAMKLAAVISRENKLMRGGGRVKIRVWVWISFRISAKIICRTRVRIKVRMRIWVKELRS